AQTPFGSTNNIVTQVFNLMVSGSAAPPAQPSAPASLRILSGNNQSGSPGALLPAQLIARVEDAAGNPVPNAAVIWQPSTSVSLSNVSSVSDANGVVSATVILGSVSGAAQVQLRTAAAGAQTVFNLTIGGATAPPPQ